MKTPQRLWYNFPAFEDGEEGEEDGVESYLEKVSTQVELDKIQGRIRRFICFGDFRASQLAYKRTLSLIK